MLPNMDSISNNMMHRSSYQKIKNVYNYKETNELPFIIGNVNYWFSNDSPKDYFDNSSSMLNYQKTKIDYHLANIRDDYIPLIFPRFGTGAVPSALGCKYVFNKEQEPVLENIIIKEPKDIRKLLIPNLYKDGIMPKVLSFIL